MKYYRWITMFLVWISVLGWVALLGFSLVQRYIQVTGIILSIGMCSWGLWLWWRIKESSWEYDSESISFWISLSAYFFVLSILLGFLVPEIFRPIVFLAVASFPIVGLFLLRRDLKRMGQQIDDGNAVKPPGVEREN